VQGLLVRDGRVLIGRRKIEPRKGHWDLPGGFLEEGELPLDGLRREFLEETGLDVRPVEWIGPTSTRTTIIPCSASRGSSRPRATVPQTTSRTRVVSPRRDSRRWPEPERRPPLGRGKAHAAERLEWACVGTSHPLQLRAETTDEEIHAAAVQYVLVSGMQKPSRANARPVSEQSRGRGTPGLLDDLVTVAPPRDREIEAARRRERAAVRFG
jgi:8-oxo-dGTP pyrophosphatase MutT (NUDIX family)